MNKHRTAEIFSPYCFWESDRSKLHLNKSKNYIITRIINYGCMEDIKKMFDYYGWETIKEEVVKIRYLDDKVFNWLSKLFKINPKKFKSYNNRGIF